MRVSNRFDFDVFGEYIRKKHGKEDDELIKKESKFIKETINTMNKIFSESLLKELEEVFERDVKVEFQYFGRCENITDDEKPPTLLMVLYTEVDGIWTDIALSSDFKVILNAHLWYVREKLVKENLLFGGDYDYRATDNKLCSLCKHEGKTKCNSPYRWEDEKKNNLLKGFHDCFHFYYDETRSDLTKEIHRLKQMQEYNAKIFYKLNKMTGWNLQEDYVKKHLKET